jgi:hypothetical protein
MDTISPPSPFIPLPAIDTFADEAVPACRSEQIELKEFQWENEAEKDILRLFERATQSFVRLCAKCEDEKKMTEILNKVFFLITFF